MSDTVTAAIVAGVVGIITGFIGSIFAPWANWGIEKRKQNLAHRRELIAKWRIMISELYKASSIEVESPKQFGEVLIQQSD